jgi:RHS repeat-associated protein
MGPSWRHSYDQSIVVRPGPTGPVTYPGFSAAVSHQYSDAATACTSGFAEIQSQVSAWASASASFTNNVCVISGSAGMIATLPIFSAWATEPLSSPVEYDVIREDGETLRYTTQGGVIQPQPGVSVQFALSGSGYTVVDNQDNIETYNSSGVLQSITSRAGVVQTMSYDSSGLLSSVTDSFGHSLSIGRSGSQVGSVTFGGGGTVYYGYDGSSRLSTLTNLDTTTRSYLYGNSSFANALTGEKDENGIQLFTWGYDTQERGTSSQLALGTQSTSLTYNSNGTVTVTDALGAVRTFAYTRLGDDNQVTSISGSQCSTCQEPAATSYDAAGWVASRKDYNGNLTCYANDPARGLELVRVEGFAVGSTCPSNLASYTPASGTVQRKISTTWSSSFRVPTQIVEPTRTTAFTYDTSGNLLTKTVTDTTVTPNVSRTWTYTYNSFGHVLTAKGPRTDLNSTTTYTYYSCTSGSQCGQLQTLTDAVGHVTTFNTYNVYGQPLTITDPNGVVTTLTYDARQRLTSRQVGTETTGLGYYPTGLLETVTLPDSSSLTFNYDTAHRLTKIQDGAGNSVLYTLDALGNRTATSTYDPSNVLSMTGSRVYNSLSELYQTVGAAGTTAVTTSFSYDANGNPTAIAAPLSRDTANLFDALNRLNQVTDPATGVTNLTYDANDHVLSVKDPTNLTTSYQYDGFGEVTQTASPASGTSTNTYDSGGNLSTAIDARSVGGTYSYDALNRVTQVAFGDQTIAYAYDTGTNGKGRLTGASDASHSMSWQYDAQGRITNRTQIVAGVTLSTSYAYSSGNLTTLTTSSGQSVTYSYTNHQITGVSINGTSLLNTVHYDPFGPPHAWSWGNGSTETRLRDTDGNPNQFTALESTSYTVDSGFRLVAVSNASNANLSWTDSYDSLDRMTGASETAQTLSWTYDGDGNRLSQGGAPGPGYAATSLTMTYNHRGRLLTAAPAGVTTTYTYNALGQRIEKSGPQTLLYAYDEAGHLIGEYTSTGALVEETIWMGDIPVATLRPRTGSGVDVYYIHADHLKTPKMVTRPSDNAIMWRWDQDPFGVAVPNQNPQALGTFVYNLRFPGQYYDAETGFSYNYFRDYDPQLGRYAESDPIGLRGGSYSTYAYVGGKPVSNRDATGRLPDPLEVIAGAIAGGIGGYVADGPRGAAIGAIAGAVVAVVTPLESESAGAASAAFLRDRFIRGVTENVVGQALGQADCGKVPTLFTIDWFQAAASGAGGASAETWAAAWGGVAPFTAQAFGALAGGAAEYDYATYLGSSF